jgi:hypothetical protein
MLSQVVLVGRARVHLGLAMGTPLMSRSQKGVYISLKVCVRDTPDLPGHVFQKYLGTQYRCL